MRVRWVKVWVDSLATLTERFRDEEGRVDFEALGREEYAFRHALVTGDFSRSERARDLYDATINEITSRSEAGRKGAEARWSKNTAAVDVSGNGCNHSQEAPTRKAGDESSDAGNGAALKSATSCNPSTADGDTREDSQAKPDGSAITRNETRDNDALEPSANIYGDAATREGVDESTTGCKNTDGGSAENMGQRTSEALPSPTPIKTDPKPTRKAKAEVKPEEQKYPHGEFGNVMLTSAEYAKLCEKCPDADSLIIELDQYIESQGKTKKYKSHYATLLNWSRRKAQESKQKKGYKTAAEKDADVLKELAEYYDKMEAV